MRTVLRGNNFRPMESQLAVLQLAIGDQLRLEPEPTNRFDPNAIKVHATISNEAGESEEHWIGYIAREDCEDVLGMMEASAIRATIASENGKAPAIEIEHDFDGEPTTA